LATLDLKSSSQPLLTAAKLSWIECTLFCCTRRETHEERVSRIAQTFPSCSNNQLADSRLIFQLYLCWSVTLRTAAIPP
jgi:hypothetical protein